MKKFEDLIVWQKAMEFAETIYKIQRKFPREETYGLGDQIRRAVVSVPSNIAEGCGRDTDADFQRFLCIARGSLFEVRTQLTLAVRLGYGKLPEEVFAQAEEIGRLLNSLIRRVRTSSCHPSPHQPLTAFPLTANR